MYIYVCVCVCVCVCSRARVSFLPVSLFIIVGIVSPKVLAEPSETCLTKGVIV